MDLRRLLPYIVGLVILAFALASLPRSQPGGSILFRSTWLLYVIYLGPIAILAIMVALVVMVGLHWRDLSSAIGFGMAQRRKARKPASRYSFIISLLFWALAVGVLITTKGSIFNKKDSINSTVTQITGENATASNPFGGVVPTFSRLIDNTWFSVAFLGLIIVAGIVIIQSIRVAMKETSDLKLQIAQENQAEGLQAVQEAIKLVDDHSTDPRSRIIACYQHLVTTVFKLGAPVSSDLTARELERAIRLTFELKGSASHDLTQLFEEARYSLHEMVDDDAEKAHGYLESIAGELNIEINN